MQPTDSRYMLVSCTIDRSKLSDFKHYVTHARPIFAANGGHPVGQYASQSVLAGNDEETFVIVMEFPSAEAIHAVFADPNYQALIPARTAAFPRLQILIADDFDPKSMLAS